MLRRNLIKPLLITSSVVIFLFIILYVTLKPAPSVITHLPMSEAANEPVPDFSQYEDITEKKKAFFAYLKTEIELQNTHIQNIRLFILAAQAKQNMGNLLSDSQMEEIEWLMSEYRVDSNEDGSIPFDDLLFKIDVIPSELVLVQAANESAWGTSRFAKKGYNFFGLWCFSEGCGFVPKRRNKGAVHEVAKFSNLSKAVYTYIRNLNRHAAYEELRRIRYAKRSDMKEVTATALSEGLMRYSERGEAYIEELQQMIRVNKELM